MDAIDALLEYKYYKYKVTEYEVVEIVKMKCPINGDWLIAVRYKKRHTDNMPTYVRSYKSFIEKFKGVSADGYR